MKTNAFINQSRDKIKQTAILERKYVIEALIMRIMKTKKKLN